MPATRSGRTAVRSPLATSSGSAIVSLLRGFVHQRGRGARGGSRSGNENGAGFALCPRDVLKERREHDSKGGSRWVSASGRGWPGTPSCLRVDTLEKHAPPGARRVSRSLSPSPPSPSLLPVIFLCSFLGSERIKAAAKTGNSPRYFRWLCCPVQSTLGKGKVIDSGSVQTLTR